MSKSRQNPMLPGVYGSASQPGTSTPKKLRTRASAGYGELGSIQREVNRMFRTTDEYARPLPHVIHVEDIFKGLNLDSEAERKLRRVVEETRSDYGSHPQLRVPRIVHARMQLSEVMRSMKQIDSSTRMEIQRRAMAYWKRNHPDFDQPPTIRYVARKSMKKSALHYIRGPMRGYAEDDPETPVFNKKDPPAITTDEGPAEAEEGEVKGSPPPKDEPPKKKDVPKPQAAGPPPKKDEAKKPAAAADLGDLPQHFLDLSMEEQLAMLKQGVDEGVITEDDAREVIEKLQAGQGEEIDEPIVSALDKMEEHEIEGGRELDFGNDVKAHLPDDADFHHHATEYAKHRAAHKIHKDKDPEKAEAHKHAANIHASIGNALHSAGDTERRRGVENGNGEMPPGGMEQLNGEPEELPQPDGPLGGGAAPPDASSPGKDISGGDLPGAPDATRNAPGRDSDIEAAKKMSGKLTELLGKMSAKQGPEEVRTAVAGLQRFMDTGRRQRAATVQMKKQAHAEGVAEKKRISALPRQPGSMMQGRMSGVSAVRQMVGFMLGKDEPAGQRTATMGRRPRIPQVHIGQAQIERSPVRVHVGQAQIEPSPSPVRVHVGQAQIEGKMTGKKQIHPVSEKQRRWAWWAESQGKLPKGKALEWSRRGIPGSDKREEFTKKKKKKGKKKEKMKGKMVGKQNPMRSRTGGPRIERDRPQSLAATHPTIDSWLARIGISENAPIRAGTFARQRRANIGMRPPPQTQTLTRQRATPEQVRQATPRQPQQPQQSQADVVQLPPVHITARPQRQRAQRPTQQPAQQPAQPAEQRPAREGRAVRGEQRPTLGVRPPLVRPTPPAAPERPAAPPPAEPAQPAQPAQPASPSRRTRIQQLFSRAGRAPARPAPQAQLRRSQTLHVLMHTGEIPYSWIDDEED